MKKFLFSLMISGIILGWSSFSSNAACDIGTPIATGYCNLVHTPLEGGGFRAELKCQDEPDGSLGSRCQLPSDIIPD